MSSAARRWLDWFRQRRSADESRPRSGRGAQVPKEVAAEFSREELMEFLEGDLYPSQADPEFKERLRADLRKLVQSRYGTPRSDDEPPS